MRSSVNPFLRKARVSSSIVALRRYPEASDALRSSPQNREEADDGAKLHAGVAYTSLDYRLCDSYWICRYQPLSSSLRASRVTFRNFESLCKSQRLCSTVSPAVGSEESKSSDDGDQLSTECIGGDMAMYAYEICRIIQEASSGNLDLESVLDQSGIEVTHDLVTQVLTRLRHARKNAERFFRWTGLRSDFVHDSRTFNSLLSIFAEHRQFEATFSLLHEMASKGVLTREAYAIALQAFAASKERKKAIGVIELVKKHNQETLVDTVNFLLHHLGRARLAKEAQLIFQRLGTTFTPNITTYTVLLSGWCRVKNVKEAGMVWNKMIGSGLKPSIVAYNLMLKGLLRMNHKSDAIKLFELMKAKGPSPNIRSYAVMIHYLCKHKAMKDAMERYNEMLHYGYQPPSATYVHLMIGFGRKKRVDIVHLFLHVIKQKGFMLECEGFNALIKLFSCQKMPSDALIVYKVMIKNGIAPTIDTFKMLIRSHFEARNFELGRAIWAEMHRVGCAPDDGAWGIFVRGFICDGRSREACECLEEMIDKGMKPPCLDYNKLASELSKSLETHALEALVKMFKLFEKPNLSNVLERRLALMKDKIEAKEARQSYQNGSHYPIEGLSSDH